MALIDALYEILERLGMVVVFLGPIGVAFFIGIIIGWAWKPKLSYSVSKAFDLSSPSSPLASVMSPLKGLRSQSSEAWTMNTGEDKGQSSVPPTEYDDCSMLQPNEQKPNVVSEEDLEHLCQLVEMKDEGPPWMPMMDRSAPNMSYEAWRRDPKDGPPQYRSSTIFEDATPEIVRDFFWDDEFRSNWDDMLASSTTIEECPTTGTMIVQWIRKFPFFCKDREYIIGRRIWESGRSYYCVTKGVPCPSVPRRDKPRRVDLYYSSWCIRAVESKRGNGQLTACEVLLFHHEDMGIPWELAKLGIRKGMWGAVKKIEPGLRAYQKARASGAPLSRPAFMAQINSKISSEYLRLLGGSDNLTETQIALTSDKPSGRNISKILIFGAAIVLACSIDRGLLTKAVIFGVARRFANIGKRL
ncbi:star-related lipid transfer protein 7, mitochondrial [Fagus crenata]